MTTNFDKHMLFRIALIVLSAFVLFALINYYNSKQSRMQMNTEKFYQDSLQNSQQPSSNELLIEKPGDLVNPSEELSNSDFRAVDYSQENKLPSDCFPRDRLTADDLLPKDSANSKWSQVNPAGQGDVNNQNYLTAGWAVGINTVSSTLRNANLQLRSEPPNPRGAWPIMNSTIESGDVLRRPMEIGGDY